MRAVFLCLALTVVATFANAQDREPLAISDGESRHEFLIELASTPEQKRTGLMFRREMAPDHGMLFVYDSEAVRTMWMRNTYLPLDMLFVGEDGVVLTIHEDAVPLDETTISSRVPALAVLELNAGVVDELDLAVGDTVEHPAFGTR